MRCARPSRGGERSFLEAAHGSATRGAVIEDARATIQRELLLGEARSLDAENRAVIGTAVGFLVREGVLDSGGTSGRTTSRRSDEQLRPGLRWSELTVLRGLLADALRTR